ncbi:hypothetical protein SAMN06298226_0706 [Nitrosovibrio sp. Nv4]|nr:hypothetical protein SAMN06298226_0706 [Nitrosovibrio sp. Nv4]
MPHNPTWLNLIPEEHPFENVSRSLGFVAYPADKRLAYPNG